MQFGREMAWLRFEETSSDGTAVPLGMYYLEWMTEELWLKSV